ncbi:DUF6328 family protein [Parafrankia sp. FMc2]|uniref:DUF6328 family protein n=1 Tax=Parafrankia sp. FMc2 TaxID=3233196 RepID=UPI0034D79E10
MTEVGEKPAEPDCHQQADDENRGPGTGETPQERLNRNWAEILQELRVAQTGVQLLSAFLLALPFQNRFSTLSSGQEWLYLGVVGLAISAMGLLVTPVSMHRAMFRKKEKENLVVVANRLAQAGLALFAVAVSGVVVLIFDVTKGFTAGVVAGVVTLVMFVVLWVAVPVAIRPLATAID